MSLGLSIRSWLKWPPTRPYLIRAHSKCKWLLEAKVLGICRGTFYCEHMHSFRFRSQQNGTILGHIRVSVRKVCARTFQRLVLMLGDFSSLKINSPETAGIRKKMELLLEIVNRWVIEWKMRGPVQTSTTSCLAYSWKIPAILDEDAVEK